MRFNVVHHGRKWRRVDNHLDARHCPHCGVTVHGNYGQNRHQEDHDETDRWMGEVSKRVGITEEEFEGRWTWSAVVDAPDELEGAE
jgi:hypothetical protein